MSDSVGQYLNEIGTVPLLNAQEERELAQMIEAGAEARQRLEAGERSQIMVIGGEDVGPREIYWNFVHTSRDRIEAAKQDWREGNFARVPGDEEFIPLPGD